MNVQNTYFRDVTKIEKQDAGHTMSNLQEDITKNFKGMITLTCKILRIQNFLDLFREDDKLSIHCITLLDKKYDDKS